MNNSRNQNLPTVFASCMNRQILVGILPVLALVLITGMALTALAGIRGNPYQSIVARNPFGLLPIPPPAPPVVEAAPAVPLPEIKLTGITTLLGTSKALFQYEDKQTKKVEFPSPLSEGQTYKTLTVLHIDVANATVRIRNGDKESTLDFINNGVKVVSRPQPVARPPVPNTRPVLPPPNPSHRAAANPDSRVIVLGGASATPVANVTATTKPNVVPPLMTRAQAEALMEMRRKQLLEQQNAQIRPANLGIGRRLR